MGKNESGQIVFYKVKWAYSDEYLSQTMKLKHELLKIFKYYTLSRGVLCESLRPKDSENVVLFGSSSF